MSIAERKRVLYARTQFWFNLKCGGSVAHTSGVLDGFKKNGCQIKIVANEAFPNAKNYDHTIIEPIFRRPTFLAELFYNFYAQRSFRKEILRFGPDIIYHRFNAYSFFVAKLARSLRIPLILEFNSFETWILKNWSSGHLIKRFIKRVLLFRMVRWVERYNLKVARQIVVVSSVLRDGLVKVGVDTKRIVVVPNGVETDKFQPGVDGFKVKSRYALEGKIILGFIGTFGQWHGVELLARSVRPIVDKLEDVHFLIVGDGKLRPSVEKIIDKHGVRQHVTFTGRIPQDDAPRYLAACDILLSPHVPNPDGTRFFGSPTKLFEYMAMGKPIVASDLDQIGEILADQKTAILCKPGDHEDFIEKVILLVQNREVWKSLGESARDEVIRNYTWRKHVSIILDHFRRLE